MNYKQRFKLFRQANQLAYQGKENEGHLKASEAMYGLTGKKHKDTLLRLMDDYQNEFNETVILQCKKSGILATIDPLTSKVFCAESDSKKVNEIVACARKGEFYKID